MILTATIISVWRPGQEVLDLTEGRRYRVFSLSASHTRLERDVHFIWLKPSILLLIVYYDKTLGSIFVI